MMNVRRVMIADSIVNVPSFPRERTSTSPRVLNRWLACDSRRIHAFREIRRGKIAVELIDRRGARQDDIHPGLCQHGGERQRVARGLQRLRPSFQRRDLLGVVVIRQASVRERLLDDDTPATGLRIGQRRPRRGSRRFHVA